MTKQEKEILKNEVLSKNSRCRICGKKAKDILPNYLSLRSSSNSNDWFSVCKEHKRLLSVQYGIKSK